MQYCNISEAWGNDNYISEQYSQTVQKNLKEHFSPIVQDLNLNRKNSKVEKNLPNMTCNQIISHVMKCPKCSREIRAKMFGNFYNNIRTTVENYREPITLVLITLFIILTINLIIKME